MLLTRGLVLNTGTACLHKVTLHHRPSLGLLPFFYEVPYSHSSLGHCLTILKTETTITYLFSKSNLHCILMPCQSFCSPFRTQDTSYLSLVSRHQNLTWRSGHVGLILLPMYLFFIQIIHQFIYSTLNTMVLVLSWRDSFPMVCA